MFLTIWYISHFLNKQDHQNFDCYWQGSFNRHRLEFIKKTKVNWRTKQPGLKNCFQVNSSGVSGNDTILIQVHMGVHRGLRDIATLALEKCICMVSPTFLFHFQMFRNTFKNLWPPPPPTVGQIKSSPAMNICMAKKLELKYNNHF